MRPWLILFLGIWLLENPSFSDIAATNAGAPVVPATPTVPGAEASARIPALYQAWKSEHDPAERSAVAEQLVDAIMHGYDHQPVEIADEVSRDGLAAKIMASSGKRLNVVLEPLTVLAGAQVDPDGYPKTVVFRRIAAHRIEAWTPKQGWLFDEKGGLVAEAKVPRRDGSGREWFGAFLPDGCWITTDIWENDQQLNAYRADGTWKWELQGGKILASLPKVKLPPGEVDELITPSIGWARADRTGHHWLISVGTDYNRDFALIGTGSEVEAVPTGSLWKLVYPRSMSVRGYFISLGIDSDDGTDTLSRDEAGHGVGVGWPTYGFLKNQWSRVIRGGDDHFGFWPNSHDIFIEAEGDEWGAPHHLWFFNAQGIYEGETAGICLGDTANGQGLLVLDAGDLVLGINHETNGPSITSVRKFNWPDGSQAVPLALYDDLKLGFFLRGPGMAGNTDDARRARRTAEVVLARWK